MAKRINKAGLYVVQARVGALNMLRAIGRNRNQAVRRH